MLNVHCFFCTNRLIPPELKFSEYPDFSKLNYLTRTVVSCKHLAFSRINFKAIRNNYVERV